MRYPELCRVKIDPRLIEAVWEAIEAMPPALCYGRHSQNNEDDVLVFGVKMNHVVKAEDFTLNMLSEDDFIGQVSWYFEGTPTPNPGDLPTILMQVTDKGISIDSKLAVWGRNVVVLSDLVRPHETLNSCSNDPSKFQYHLASNEKDLTSQVLFHLRQRCH